MRNLIQNIPLCIFLFLPWIMYAGTQTEAARKAYIDQHKPYALMVELRHGIPASICMAQALLETDAGRSLLNGKGNNHFGIKAGRYWRGPTMSKIDDKVNAEGMPIPSSFRVYPSIAASFHDYGRMMATSKRYGRLLALDKSDYKSWAYGIYALGYASNKQYAQLLIHLIERYELDKIRLLDVQTIPSYGLVHTESTAIADGAFWGNMPEKAASALHFPSHDDTQIGLILLLLVLNLLYLNRKGKKEVNQTAWVSGT